MVAALEFKVFAKTSQYVNKCQYYSEDVFNIFFLIFNLQFDRKVSMIIKMNEKTCQHLP